MPTILCYGDSLTWGTNPDPAGQPRHDLADRWPGALAAGLGAGYEVVAEGLGGRTTAFDDHLADCDRNGARLLPTMLQSHRPVDLCILMLGTNDLKPAVAGNAVSACLGLKRCVEIVTRHSARVPGFLGTKAMIVAPPAIIASRDALMAELFVGAQSESLKLASLFAGLAKEFGCAFFDAATVASASPIDGVHLDAANTRAIGEALVPLVRAHFAAQ